MEALLTGLGLSGSAGLNAYLPLLVIGICHRLELMQVREPYDTLSSTPVLIVLAVLLLLEMTADKIPGVDHANDLLNTVVRPVAGAILFTSSTSAVGGTDPTLLTVSSLLAGSLSAGAIHALKASARPAVSVTTAGFGNAFVSVIEDIIALLVSMFAILLPFVVIFFAMSVVSLTGWLVWDIRRTQRYFGRAT
ncbi:MAG: DUF4126 domain-containing protein [Anaerolineae bacterium]|nr:DUF4126 domain-containing protein [Anaerolineae bacterium]